MEQIANELLKTLNDVTCHEDIFMRSEEIEQQLIKWTNKERGEVSGEGQRWLDQILQSLTKKHLQRFSAPPAAFLIRESQASDPLD